MKYKPDSRYLEGMIIRIVLLSNNLTKKVWQIIFVANFFKALHITQIKVQGVI